VLSVEPIAIMMRKDDPAFKKAVDDSIKAMMKSGEIAKLYDKWFMQPIPPSNTKVGLPPATPPRPPGPARTTSPSRTTKK
jgi:glutamate/aspartate transport system substrate-binding protein